MRQALIQCVKSLFYFKKSNVITFFLLMLNLSISAQISGKLDCYFSDSTIVLKKGEIISNLLCIKNNTDLTKEFYLELSKPSTWNVITNTNKLFTLNPNDSVFIPIRIHPKFSSMKGGTFYSINLFILNTEGRNLGSTRFFVSKPKVSKLILDVLPRSRIYFLNNEQTTNVTLNIKNLGDESQNLNLSWKVIGSGLSVSYDSNNLNRSFIDFSIKEDQDSNFTFVSTLMVPDLNFKRVDLETYNANQIFESRKYNIRFSAVETSNASIRNGTKKTSNAELRKLGNSIDVVKLSNIHYMNPFGSAVVPIIWNSNLFNLVGIQPMLQNTFRTNFILPNQASVNGIFQHFFSFYSPSDQTFNNISGIVSYMSRPLDVLLGGPSFFRDPILMGISTGYAGSRGINTSLRPNDRFEINAFLGRNQSVFTNRPNSGFSFGSGVSFKPNKNLKSSFGYSQYNNTLLNRRLQNIPVGFRYKLNSKHTFQAGFAVVNLTDSLNTNSVNSTIGNNWRLNYTGRFFENKLTQTFTFLKRDFTAGNLSGSFRTSYVIRSMSNIDLEKLRIQVVSGFFQNNFLSRAGAITENYTIPTTVNINVKRFKKIRTFPSIYHTYTKVGIANSHQRGIVINSNVFNYEKNTLLALSIRAGYNSYSDTLRKPEIFNAQAFIMFNYHNFSANIRYMYGPLNFFGVQQFHYSTTRYPQYIFSSVNKQHVFSNPKIVGDFSLNHSWNNILHNHNIGLTPQLYYFAKSGWRFNVMAFYNISATNSDRATEFYQFQNSSSSNTENNQNILLSTNFNFSVGVRKEFGIPVPKKFAKAFYSDVTFLAFLDFNGNKVFDIDEIALENIVIRLGGYEVITDANGKAFFKNVQQKKYESLFIPLIDLNGWFTSVKDSIDINEFSTVYIPYTRGVKIEGKVEVDREKYSLDIAGEIDLSRIKIFALDSIGNFYSTLTDLEGYYSFYVPYGKYTLNFDESILSDKFNIAENEIEIDLIEGLNGFYQSFFLFEKRRVAKKKRFDKDGNLILTE